MLLGRGPAYPVDLHAHSLRSDGVYEPAELVRQAAARGVEVLALSDHDTLSGVAEAVAEGERAGVRVVPAVELNTESTWGDVHVLGYFLDPGDIALEERLRWLRENRGRRIELMVERLVALGYPVTLERVIEIAAGGALGRPHLAQALVEAGHARSYDDAFDTLLHRTSPAYVARVGLSPREAVELIAARGGVAVLAHPWTVANEAGPENYELARIREVVGELVPAGLAGLESYHYRSPAALVPELEALAGEHGLVVTGGSDFHGIGEHMRALGGAYVPPDAVARLEARIHSSRATPSSDSRRADRPAAARTRRRRAAPGGAE